MIHLTDLDFFFWAAGFLGNIALLFILYVRRRRAFPFFTALISLGVVQSIVLYLVHSHASKDSYAIGYRMFTLLDTLLQLCVAYELASRVFRPLDVWAEDLRTSFLWIVLLGIAAALGLMWLASPPAKTWLQALSVRGNLFAATLMTELFVGMLALSVIARIPWRSHTAKIAQGLGAYSLLTVLIETGHAYFGAGREAPMFVVLSHVRMVFYLGCVGYWILGLWPSEEPGRSMPREMHQKIFDLQSQVAYDLQYLRSRRKG